jgi:RimJ/RimL family protein N-acetyltransferase|tara:strand:- start:1135 stop:1527 length:393 start_codon:yes stop_codon:yes gene_type:complete
MVTKTFVQNNPDYWEFIRNLRNMDGVKEGFIEQEYIEKSHHKMYMEAWGNCFYLCLVNDQPAGYVGVIRGDIRVATHPNFQGMGVGTYMITEIMKFFPNATAKVKLENEASLRLFQKCNFKKKYYLLQKE